MKYSALFIYPRYFNKIVYSYILCTKKGEYPHNMNMQAYVDEIKLDVTGGILELEIPDSTIQRIVNSAMRELQRYICSTKLLTLKYEKAIDLSQYSINSVARVYRAEGLNNTTSGSYTTDPLMMGLFQIGTNMQNMNDFTSRYTAYSTMQQIGNTLSTDLAFYYDDAVKKLYINTHLTVGDDITIEYVPRYNNVEEITSDFWIDVLMRLSKALTKVALGRIRGRYVQSNALWTSDAQTMLAEGQQELNDLRTYLQANTQLLYAID